jgi:hypothetical protein
MAPRVRVVKPIDMAGIMQLVDEITARKLQETGIMVAEKARQELTTAGRVDSGNLRDSITEPIDTSDENAPEFEVRAEADYAIFVELGRAPGGKQPPHDVLVKWAKSRLGLAGDEAEEAAWAIGRSIAQNGIVGAHFMRSAIESVDLQALARSLEKEINE